MAIEWPDLSREFKQETVHGWVSERKKPVEKTSVKLTDKARAIAEGRVSDLLISGKPEKANVSKERVSAIEARLRELDAEIALYKNRSELRPEPFRESGVLSMWRPNWTAWRRLKISLITMNLNFSKRAEEN